MNFFLKSLKKISEQGVKKYLGRLQKSFRNIKKLTQGHSIAAKNILRNRGLNSDEIPDFGEISSPLEDEDANSDSDSSGYYSESSSSKPSSSSSSNSSSSSSNGSSSSSEKDSEEDACIIEMKKSPSRKGGARRKLRDIPEDERGAPSTGKTKLENNLTCWWSKYKKKLSEEQVQDVYRALHFQRGDKMTLRLQEDIKRFFQR